MRFKKELSQLVRKHKKIFLILTGLFFFALIQNRGYGQEKLTRQDSLHLMKEVDIFDVIRKWTGKPPKLANDVPQIRVQNLSLLPVLGYSPANGFVVGAAVSITEFLGNPKTTQLSSALINASFTTKSQILLNLRYDVYLPDSKWYISGDNRLLFFTQPTYGLGIYGLQNQNYTFGLNGDGNSVQRADSSQPMKFNYIRLYETFLRHITKRWYAGLAIMIDDNFKINDESLRLDSPRYLTSHYIYSKSFGFDTAHYSANGLSLQIMHDSRDNPVNAFSGNYFNLAFRFNPVAFGSTQSSTMLYTEYRTYFSLNKSIPRNVLAFWLWGTFVTSGHMPYLELPSITWDTYNRSGRGYIQGRFRGPSMIYGETEYRFRLSRNGLFGGVVFANVTTASNPITHQSVFNSLAPGYGAGLRIKMNKADRTNICIDYGRGDGFSGIYFNIREAF